eukprot:contig_5487_g1245
MYALGVVLFLLLVPGELAGRLLGSRRTTQPLEAADLADLAPVWPSPETVVEGGLFGLVRSLPGVPLADAGSSVGVSIYGTADLRDVLTAAPSTVGKPKARARRATPLLAVHEAVDGNDLLDGGTGVTASLDRLVGACSPTLDDVAGITESVDWMTSHVSPLDTRLRTTR